MIKKSILSLGVLLSLLTFITPAYGATYTIDPEHTQVSFKVKHLGISYVRGLFTKLEGSIEYDPANVASSKTMATIQAASIDTDNKKRDDHLRSADFLNAAKYPKLSFVSKEVKNVKEDSFTVVGDLTLHGITKSIELDVEVGGMAKDPWGNERVAFSSETELNRKDFGLAWSKLLESGGLVVGDEVKIAIEVEGIKQK